MLDIFGRKKIARLEKENDVLKWEIEMRKKYADMWERNFYKAVAKLNEKSDLEQKEDVDRVNRINKWLKDLKESSGID